MNPQSTKQSADTSRRKFLVGAAALTAAPLLTRHLHAASSAAITFGKAFAIGLCLFTTPAALTSAAEKPASPSTRSGTNAEQEILSLSKEKWRWMSERKVESLETLFHAESVFVHMGGTMSRSQELDVIKTGRIHYKDVDIQEASVRFVGATAIVLNKIRLIAVVGGNEVTNPFVVTEVYVRESDIWKLASLSFTRLGR